MAYALFLGCKIPYFVPQYETSTRTVLAELGISFSEMAFNCCGYPMRHLYLDSYLTCWPAPVIWPWPKPGGWTSLYPLQMLLRILQAGHSPFG